MEPDSTQTNENPSPRSSEPETGSQAPADLTDNAAALEPGGFMAASMAELRRVVWPSRQQLFSESVAVIFMVTLSAAAIAVIDRFYGWAATQVFR